MEITLRTVYFQKVIEIKNVPVISCQGCGKNKLMTQVIDKMKELMWTMNNRVKKEKIVYFDRISEFAQLIVFVYKEQKYYQEDFFHMALQELLESYTLIEKDYWYEKVHKKLVQLVH